MLLSRHNTQEGRERETERAKRKEERDSPKDETICISRHLDAGGGLARYANLNSPLWETRKITVLFRNKVPNYLHALRLLFAFRVHRSLRDRLERAHFPLREVNDIRVEKKSEKKKKNIEIMLSRIDRSMNSHPRGCYSRHSGDRS